MAGEFTNFKIRIGADWAICSLTGNWTGTDAGTGLLLAI